MTWPNKLIFVLLSLPIAVFASGSGASGGDASYDDDTVAGCPSEVSASNCCIEVPSWSASIAFEVTKCNCAGLPHGQCTSSHMRDRCEWVDSATTEADCNDLSDRTTCEENAACSWESNSIGDEGHCAYMGCRDTSCHKYDYDIINCRHRPDCYYTNLGLCEEYTPCSCASLKDSENFCPCLSGDQCEQSANCDWVDGACEAAVAR